MSTINSIIRIWIQIINAIWVVFLGIFGILNLAILQFIIFKYGTITEETVTAFEMFGKLFIMVFLSKFIYTIYEGYKELK